MFNLGEIGFASEGMRCMSGQTHARLRLLVRSPAFARPWLLGNDYYTCMRTYFPQNYHTSLYNLHVCHIITNTCIASMISTLAARRMLKANVGNVQKAGLLIAQLLLLLLVVVLWFVLSLLSLLLNSYHYYYHYYYYYYYQCRKE